MRRNMTTTLLIIGAAALLGCGILSSCKSKKAEVETPATAADSTLVTSLHQPEWSRNAVIYEVNWRQSTPSGTIKEYMPQLDRLKDLGVDIIWMMPVHPISEKNRKGTLGSYYAVKDYKALNPELGTMDDFKAFVDEAHKKGMKVIIDWVPNHSGCDNAWVKEHPSWYARNEKGEMYGPYDWTDVYKFNYSNPEMREGMTDALKFWVTEVGVDGFRCDVAGEVPVDFWDEVRPKLDAAKEGGVFMLAEASVPALQVNGFNMGYNWPMKDVFNAIAATAGQNTYDSHEYRQLYASAIDSLVKVQAKEYPKDTYLMNMITNHDLNSWEGTEFQRLGNLTEAFAVISYTLPGMPLIYTGQETGMNRAFEFFEKDKAPDWEPRNEYFTFYQKLNALKHNEAALRAGEEGGEMKDYPATDKHVLAFSRTKGDSQVTVVANLGNEEATVAFDGEAPNVDIETMTDYFAGSAASMPETLKAGEWRVFVKNK
ncbi:MAG: alpha-amylase [Muribaculaceae bacterium]|nr:alpha-amylase [Muribaculaceae bacterium]